MKRSLVHLPLIVTVALCALLLAYGPIAQPPNYHQLADRSELAGLPHAADVLSNIGFAAVAIWGILRLRRMPADAGRHGYRLFLAGLLLTSIGSAFYHLAPDNARLVWDRLPIALACAGLLAAVRAECLSKPDSRAAAWSLGIFAVLSAAEAAVFARIRPEAAVVLIRRALAEPAIEGAARQRAGIRAERHAGDSDHRNHAMKKSIRFHRQVSPKSDQRCVLGPAMRANIRAIFRGGYGRKWIEE